MADKSGPPTIANRQGHLNKKGINDSASYVREPQGNGIAECFVRILKNNLLWIRSFRTVEELRLAFLAFKKAYNRLWRIGRHGSGQGRTEGEGHSGGMTFPPELSEKPQTATRRT